MNFDEKCCCHWRVGIALCHLVPFLFSKNKFIYYVYLFLPVICNTHTFGSRLGKDTRYVCLQTEVIWPGLIPFYCFRINLLKRKKTENLLFYSFRNDVDTHECVLKIQHNFFTFIVLDTMFTLNNNVCDRYEYDLISLNPRNLYSEFLWAACWITYKS